MRSQEEVNAKIMLNRIEELVLHEVFEQISKSNLIRQEMGSENDFERGFNEGFDDAVERLWEIIQEHLDHIDYKLAR